MFCSFSLSSKSWAFLGPSPDTNWSWFWTWSFFLRSLISRPTKLTISIITFYKLFFNTAWLTNRWYGWRFIERTPFLVSFSLHKEIISAIGFFFSLAIETASIMASYSMKPSVIFFFATSLGTSYSPKAQKMVSGNKSGVLSSFLKVCAFLQLAAMSIISGLYSLMLCLRL